MKDISLPGKPTIIFLVLVLALMLSGCATKAYEGPDLPRSEIAVLLGHEHGDVVIPLLGHKHRTSVIEIDGKKRSAARHEIHILPGQHTARVHYFRYPDVKSFWGPIGGTPNYETRDLSITFMAKAGHENRIPAERRGERNWVWVEDITESKTNGKVVAGEKPPEKKAKEKNPNAILK
ncbi:MAG: hypothetical protein V3T46_00445 [Alphaproteobacteria bacterium]